MATRRKRRNTQIIVATIGTAGVLGAAIITVLPTLLRPPPNSSSSAVGSSTPSEPNSAPVPENTDPGLQSASKQAEQIAREWLAAFLGRDVDTLVRLAKPPLFLNGQALTSASEIRARYKDIAENSHFPSGRVGSTKVTVGTIDEYRKLEHAVPQDQVLTKVVLSGSDIYVTIRFQLNTRRDGNIDGESTLYFRRVNGGLDLRAIVME